MLVVIVWTCRSDSTRPNPRSMVKPAHHACYPKSLVSLELLNCCSLQACRWASTSPRWVQNAFSQLRLLGLRCIRRWLDDNCRRHTAWFTRLSPSRRTSCSVFSTQLRASCQTRQVDRGLTHFRRHVLYIGSTWLTGSGSGCASTCPSTAQRGSWISARVLPTCL